MSRVAGKVVLVSGAGSGIGRATATLLAQEGATLSSPAAHADEREAAGALGGE